MEKILVVEDEKLLRWSLVKKLVDSGYNVCEANSMKGCFEVLKNEDPDLILLDQILPDGTGLDIICKLNRNRQLIPIIMLTAVDKSSTAVQALKLGAIDYLTKPINFDELIIVIEKALENHRTWRQLEHLIKTDNSKYGFMGLIGASKKMKNLFEEIAKIAKSDSTTVLITGESGTGKELVARAVHALSNRCDKPLMTINCAALTETLIETELFGYEKGAFTDAKSLKKGIFELAHKSTVFLDEIGDISQKLQVKLLRILEYKTFQRVGGTDDISVDVRIIAATNQPLNQKLEDGSFRTDLFYRLNVANINVPPLRERNEDIILLATHFINEFNKKFHKNFKGLSEETKKLFLNYTWPGNVRELKNFIERAILLYDRDYLIPEYFEAIKNNENLTTKSYNLETLPLFELEKRAIINALKSTNYNQTKAAKLLNISRDTLRYRLKKYNIKAD